MNRKPFSTVTSAVCAALTLFCIGGVSLWFCQSVWGCSLVAFSGAFRPVSGAVDVGPA